MSTHKESIAELARAKGIKPTIVHNRVAKGWSLEKALTTPVRLRKSRKRKVAANHDSSPTAVAEVNKIDINAQFRAVTEELEEASTRLRIATDFNDTLINRLREKDKTISRMMLGLAVVAALQVVVWYASYV